MPSRGSALVTLLILITLIFTALMLIFSRQAQREYAYRLVENRGQGQLLASSGLSQAIAAFGKDKTFGQAGQSLRETIPCDGDDAAYFTLSFEADAARRGADVPECCISNWGKDTPVYNASRSEVLCPENALYLVCYSYYRGQRYSASALLAAPPFDSAVASGATVRSDDGFLLGSVPAGFDARNGVRPEDLTEAKMQAGGDISIHGKSLLVGKALAAHNVDYDKATVDLTRGSIVGNSKIDAVPDIDLSKLDFTGKSGVQTLTGPFAAKTTLSGLAQGKSLTFSNGLHLDGGVLRLSGNLVVQGGITGRGALIVDGNVTIVGASNLSTDNQVAVLAGGGINVTGTGSSNSYFQGLLYSKGEQGVSVVNSTLLGTLVSTSATAPVQVERAVIAYDAKATKIGAKTNGIATLARIASQSSPSARTTWLPVWKSVAVI